MSHHTSYRESPAPRIPSSTHSPTTDPTDPSPRARFLSEADCHDIAHRLATFAKGGGVTSTTIVSTWTGNVRWARNRVTTSGEVRNDNVVVNRNLQGAFSPYVYVNDISDAALVAAARRAERLAQLRPQAAEYDLLDHFPHEPFESPQLFSNATYQLDAERRSAAAHQLMLAAKSSGMLSAGYLEVSAHSIAFIKSTGYARYFQYTWAQFSTTVRDPTGTGSGWAGMDSYDWATIPADHLAQVALDKCVRSQHPVVIEPGRYTTILEPQAVSDLVGQLLWDIRGTTPFEGGALDRDGNESADAGPFSKKTGVSKLGDRVIDPRITISSNLMDPELGFPPFRALQNMYDAGNPAVDVYHPVTWIRDGVLVNLAMHWGQAIRDFGQRLGVLNAGAFRMSATGTPTSMADMIATTKRGLLVTRFSDIMPLDFRSQLCRGYTRDGLWLIENGKVSHPVKNLAFTESMFFALNNVEQVGSPQRVFHPPQSYIWWKTPQPAIVPALKVNDFSFTALSDAI